MRLPSYIFKQQIASHWLLAIQALAGFNFHSPMRKSRGPLSSNRETQTGCPQPLLKPLNDACRANYTVTVDGWPSSADPSPEKPPQAEGFSPDEKVTAEPSPPQPQQAERSGRGMDRGDPGTPEKASEVGPTKSGGRTPRKRTRSRSVPRFATPQRQLPGYLPCCQISQTVCLGEDQCMHLLWSRWLGHH